MTVGQAASLPARSVVESLFLCVFFTGGHLFATMTWAATMTSDAELLQRYANERTEEAVAELVRRHLDLVHSAALRQVGSNPAAAADVTQSVFIELARQAGGLIRHPSLTGWLYTTTRRMAARYIRTEARRQHREREAHTMQELQRSTEPDADWDRIRPVLDAAMHDLGEADRLAILLRHFERRPLAEVGACLGLSENAARMRVDRALEKLRAKLARLGVTSTASALPLALAGQSVTAAPAALASTITTAALAAGVTATSTFGLLTFMASTPLKLATGALLLAVAGTALVLQQYSKNELAADNAGLRQQVAHLMEEAQASRQAVSQAAEELTRLRQPPAELLRLRGEIARLRQELAGTRRAEASPTVPPEPSPEEQEAAYREGAIRRMTGAKLLVLGFHLFASSHEDRFPDSLDLALAQLNSETAGTEGMDTIKTLQTEDFELMFRGSLKDIANPSAAIILRERQALPTPKGTWARTYGFADGHSELHSSDDGDFAAWEAQHQVQSATGNRPGAAGE